MDIENDELACQSQQRNEDHHFRLYDALMPGHEIPQRVIEFERDQQCHDLAEERLKYRVIQWIDGSEQECGNDRDTQPVQRDDDDERNHGGQN